MNKQISNRLLVLVVFAAQILVAQVSWANGETGPLKSEVSEQNGMDELNPFDPNIDFILDEMDQAYEQETGKPSHLPYSFDVDGLFSSGCYRATCKVWAHVSKADQKLYLYVNGNRVHEWDVSTGARGHGTPDFDKHPNGRIYDRYTSKKFPGGDYNKLGNMPYAVFISGGFAIHGTGIPNWSKLGRPASHGCIRLHPDNAFIFNRLVRQHGITQVWITVE